MYRYFFHQHTPDDLKKGIIGKRNFKERAIRYFNESGKTTHVKNIYTPRGTPKEYRIKWTILDESSGDAFSSVFYHYGVFCSLDFYPEQKRTEQCGVTLALDFDSKNVCDALEDMRKVAQFLLKHKIVHQVFFSGSKGGHIEIQPEVFKQEMAADNHLVNRGMVEIIQNEIGHLPALDFAIYSSRRMFRMPNSIHPKTLLRKRPLSSSEAIELTADEIKKLARKPLSNWIRPVPIFNGYLHQVYLKACQNVSAKPKYTVDTSTLSEFQGGHLPPCIKDAMENGIKEGSPANRNLTTLFLATFFKGQGKDMHEAITLLIEHALTVLKPFSSSNNAEIRNSTKTCVTAVYRSNDYRFNCSTARKYLLECGRTCSLWSKNSSVKGGCTLKWVKDKIYEPPVFLTLNDIREEMPRVINGYIAQYY